MNTTHQSITRRILQTAILLSLVIVISACQNQNAHDGSTIEPHILEKVETTQEEDVGQLRELSEETLLSDTQQENNNLETSVEESQNSNPAATTEESSVTSGAAQLGGVDPQGTLGVESSQSQLGSTGTNAQTSGIDSSTSYTTGTTSASLSSSGLDTSENSDTETYGQIS